MPSPPRYRKGETIGGRYIIHKVLQGGMGEVYLCLDVKYNEPYALKTFQQRYLTNPDIRRLFEEEVGTWIALEKHPNIVRCFWMETLDNQPFMELEWVAGEEGRGTDLRGWLRRGPLDLRLALDFTIDICRGLLHANKKKPGIVHRDLKPDNILVSQGRLAKITDFGLAMVAQKASLDLADDDAADDHTTHQHTKRAGGAVGTPPYMPPEQWQGGNIDARADIYAVGCILYELLTGQFPYTATTLNGFRQQHEQAPLPALPADSSLPPALNDLLAGCLAKQSDDRFPDVAALLDAVTTLYRQQMRTAPRSIPETGVFTTIDYNNRGNTYYHLGCYEEALADLTHAIELDPAFALTYVNRGVTYHTLGSYDEALANYSRAITLDPAHVPAYANRGHTYHHLGRYEEALADFTRAITLDPVFKTVYDSRGGTYHHLGRYEEALADFTRAITLDPVFAQAFYNRGTTYKSLGRYEDALADFNRAITLDPADVSAYINRGHTYGTLCRYEDALADFNRAITLDPGFALSYANRGLTYDDLGRYEEALEDYTRAINLDPTLVKAYMGIGALLGDQGKLHEALPYFEKASQLGDPQGAEFARKVRQHLGMQE